MEQHSPQQSQGQPKTFKSQAYIPIRQDERSFEERQRNIWDQMQDDLDKNFLGRGIPDARVQMEPPAGFMGRGSIWDDMQSRMDEKRKNWEHEVERLRTNFFDLTPLDGKPSGPSNGHPSVMNPLTRVQGNSQYGMGSDQKYVDKGEGQKAFTVSFDVHDFTAEEIDVRTQDNKLVVNAKHEETGEGKNVSREFSRTVDIPAHVDIMKLQSTLSKDGILQVEAPVEAPSYEKITQNGQTPSPPGYVSPPSYNSPQLQRHNVSINRGSPVSNGGPFVTHRSSPSTVLSNGMAGPEGYKSGSVVTEKDGSQKMKLTVYIGKEFQPGDINVKTVDNKLQIVAKHEEVKDGRTMVKEFSKELDLPGDVDPKSVTASVSEDGKLIVEAPMSSYTQGSYMGAPGSTKQPEISVVYK